MFIFFKKLAELNLFRQVLHVAGQNGCMSVLGLMVWTEKSFTLKLSFLRNKLM